MLVTLKRLNLLPIQSRIIFNKNKRYLEGFSGYLENLSAIFRNFWNDIQAILRDICRKFLKVAMQLLFRSMSNLFKLVT